MAFPAVGDPGTDTVAPPNDWASKLLAGLANGMDSNGNLVSSYAKLGTNPAASGALRLGNNQWIAARNNTNTGDLNLIKVSPSNFVSYGVRFTSDGYFSDTNRAVDTAGDYTMVSAYVQRLGGGVLADTTIGFANNIVDNVLARKATITGATNASPIVITATGHGFTNGTVVAVGSVLGNTAANGKWVVANAAANTFELQGSIGNGAYTSGGDATSAGALYGASFVVTPKVTRVLGAASSGAAAFGDDVIGCSVYNAGTVKGTAGFVVGGGVTGLDWSEGIGIDAACFIGIAFTGISGNYGYGINLGGTYDNNGINFPGTYTGYGIDFQSGTYTGRMMRLKQNAFVSGRNAADSADVDLFKINNLNELQIASPARLSGTTTVSALLFFDEGFNLQFGTTTGTKIGTGTTQKIGFWNATPVVRPSAYTQTYSTADKTLATQTSATLTNANGTGSTTIADVGAAFSQTTLNNIIRSLSDQINALRVDLLDADQFINAVVDDLQAMGLVG